MEHRKRTECCATHAHQIADPIVTQDVCEGNVDFFPVFFWTEGRCPCLWFLKSRTQHATATQQPGPFEEWEESVRACAMGAGLWRWPAVLGGMPFWKLNVSRSRS